MELCLKRPVGPVFQGKCDLSEFGQSRSIADVKLLYAKTEEAKPILILDDGAVLANRNEPYWGVSWKAYLLECFWREIKWRVVPAAIRLLNGGGYLNEGIPIRSPFCEFFFLRFYDDAMKLNWYALTN